MSRKKLVKIELSNPRFVRSEILDHASEFIHYARYAGYVMEGFNKHLSGAKLFPVKPEIAERNHRLVVETTLVNAGILYQITQIYPSFKNWSIKMITPGIETVPPFRKKSEPVSRKKVVGKKAVRKKTQKVKAKKTAGKKPATKVVKKAKSVKKR